MPLEKAAESGVRGVHSSRPMEGADPTYSKEEVGYTEKGDGTERECENCRFFSVGACELVQGPISPEGVCKLFSPTDYRDLEKPDTDDKAARLTDARLADFYRLDDVGAAGGSGRSWAPVFPEGKFQHPEYGELDFTGPELRKYVANFDERIRKIDICVDVDHENKVAVGWLKRLQIRPGIGLFGLVEWNTLGQGKLADRQYRYISPQFGEYVDEETGEVHESVLVALTITNFPFLKKMPAIALSEREAQRLENVEQLIGRFAETGRRRLARAGLLRRASAWMAGEGPPRRRLSEGIAILRLLRSREQSAPVGNAQGGADRKMKTATGRRALMGVPGKPPAKTDDDDASASRLDDDDDAMAELDDEAKEADDGDSADQTARRAKKAKKAVKAKKADDDDESAKEAAEDDDAMAELYDQEDVWEDDDNDQFAPASRQAVPAGASERRGAQPRDAKSLAEANREIARLRDNQQAMLAEVREAQKTLRLTHVKDQVRKLAESGNGQIALSRPVLVRFRDIALRDKAAGDAVYDLLREIVKTGLVELNARGRAGSGDDNQHDPVVGSKSRKLADGKVVVDEDVVRRAQMYARENKLDWGSLEDRLTAMLAAENGEAQADDGYAVREGRATRDPGFGVAEI